MTFFGTNDILIIVFFWCKKKLYFREKKNNFSGSIFCDQLFCELQFKLIFSEKNSNRKNIFGLQTSKLDFYLKKNEDFLLH